jgi:hypothetical protein
MKLIASNWTSCITDLALEPESLDGVNRLTVTIDDLANKLDGYCFGQLVQRY